MFFGGAPLWHVSVALWSPLTRTPKPVSSWTGEDRTKAERYAKIALQGAGVEDRTISEDGAVAMHVRRETTDRERDYVFRTPRGRAASRTHEQGGAK